MGLKLSIFRGLASQCFIWASGSWNDNIRNVFEDVQRVTSAVDIPLLVDMDTGWGNHLMIERAVKSLIRGGAAAVHIEDQPFAKRCGHRKGKAVVSVEEMVDKSALQ